MYAKKTHGSVYKLEAGVVVCSFSKTSVSAQWAAVLWGQSMAPMPRDGTAGKWQVLSVSAHFPCEAGPLQCREESEQPQKSGFGDGVDKDFRATGTTLDSTWQSQQNSLGSKPAPPFNM